MEDAEVEDWEEDEESVGEEEGEGEGGVGTKSDPTGRCLASLSAWPLHVAPKPSRSSHQEASRGVPRW